MIQVCHSKFQYHFSTFAYVEAIFGIDLKWMYERYVCKTILLCLIGHIILVIFLDKLSVICISDEQWQLRKSTYDLNWFRRLESCFSVNQYFLFLTRMFLLFLGKSVWDSFILRFNFQKLLIWETIFSLLLTSVFKDLPHRFSIYSDHSFSFMHAWSNIWHLYNHRFYIPINFLPIVSIYLSI